VWRKGRAIAKSAYLDSPLPSRFKERLFVHLSRFCEIRYCIVRHVGFLIGQGRPAGDAAVELETVEQVVETCATARHRERPRSRPSRKERRSKSNPFRRASYNFATQVLWHGVDERAANDLPDTLRCVRPSIAFVIVAAEAR
jgi:hypothetical protein